MASMSELLSAGRSGVTNTASPQQHASAAAAPTAAVGTTTPVDVVVGLLSVMGIIYGLTLVERRFGR